MVDSRGGLEDRNELRAATLSGVAEVRTFLIIIYVDVQPLWYLPERGRFALVVFQIWSLQRKEITPAWGPRLPAPEARLDMSSPNVVIST